MTGVALRTVLGFLRRRARRDGIADGRSGALVLDGVFTKDGSVVHPSASRFADGLPT